MLPNLIISVLLHSLWNAMSPYTGCKEVEIQIWSWMYVNSIYLALMSAAHLYKTSNSFKCAKVKLFFYSYEKLFENKALFKKCKQSLNIYCNILSYPGVPTFSAIIWLLILTIASVLPRCNYYRWQLCKDCLDWRYWTRHVHCFDMLP